MYPRLDRRTLILLLALMIGCDDRVIQVAREAADRQAQQNTTMAELHKEVAGGTKRLVEADSQSRTELLNLQRDLQAERGRLDTGWAQLEDDRRQIATGLRTESMLLMVAKLVSSAFVVVSLLGFCWYARVAIRQGDTAEADLNELLIRELVLDQPLLLPRDPETALTSPNRDANP